VWAFRSSVATHSLQPKNTSTINECVVNLTAPLPVDPLAQASMKTKLGLSLAAKTPYPDANF
jgi:hypothetical protein